MVGVEQDPMDPTDQVYESDATPLQRGLYADIQKTLRAPIANSIWRTLVANVPEYAPYVWGQMKPAFETREFAAFTVAFRDRILSPVDDALPEYTAADVDLQPITDAPVYSDARRDGFALAETYLDRLPYTPRIDPDGLAEQGADRETIEELRDMIELFVSGGETILPLLHIHAATVGATGERRTVTFP